MEKSEEKRLQEWKSGEKTVTLTKGQWSSLTMYLNMSARYREEEKESWEKLAAEKDENGNPKFKHADSNAKFWGDMIETLQEVKKGIDGEYCRE
jgi:hypothetical protein